MSSDNDCTNGIRGLASPSHARHRKPKELVNVRRMVTMIGSVTGVGVLAVALTLSGMMTGGATHDAMAASNGINGGHGAPISRGMVFNESTVASRDAVRTSLDEDADWGGIEELDIPVTMSDSDRKALKSLKDSMSKARKLHSDSKGRTKDDKSRAMLKKALDDAERTSKGRMVVASASDAKRKAIEDAMSKVNADVDRKKADDEAEYARMQALAERESVTSGIHGIVPNQSPSDPKTTGKGDGDSVVDYAMGFIGRPYVWGAEGPDSFDCSGLVKYVFSKFGVSLPHYSGAQMSAGEPVASLSDAKPGDIVVSPTHAAIYIGDGRIINALNPSEGVKVTGLNVFSDGYAIRRLVK